MLIRERGLQTDGMQTALIIKSRMPFSFIFTKSNSFKYELFSENVLINFSFLILFQLKSSFTFSFRNVLWLPESNSMRNMDFLFHSNYWHKFWVFVPKRIYFCSCRIEFRVGPIWRTFIQKSFQITKFFNFANKIVWMNRSVKLVPEWFPVNYIPVKRFKLQFWKFYFHLGIYKVRSIMVRSF